jgi:hypothetical protein
MKEKRNNDQTEKKEISTKERKLSKLKKKKY